MLLNTYIVLKRGKDWKCNCFICLVRVYLGCLVCPLSCPLSTRKDDIKDDSMWKEIMKLILKPTFILIGIGTFLINMAYFVPLFYIPDMAVFMGVERTKANFLLSIFGKFNCYKLPILPFNLWFVYIYLSALANTIGKLSCGWLSDRSCISALLVFNTYIFLSGITIFFMPFCHSHELYVAVISAYGFFSSVCSLEAIVLVEILGTRYKIWTQKCKDFCPVIWHRRGEKSLQYLVHIFRETMTS